MIKRLELAESDSCLNRAKDEEMLFILMGRDVAAPMAIRAWVRERVRLNKNHWPDPKISEALDCAEEMERGRGNPKPAPDTVTVDLTVRYSLRVEPAPDETLEEAVKARRQLVWQAVRSFGDYLGMSNVNRNPGQLLLTLVEARDDAGASFIPHDEPEPIKGQGQ